MLKKSNNLNCPINADKSSFCTENELLKDLKTVLDDLALTTGNKVSADKIKTNAYSTDKTFTNSILKRE